MSKHLKEETSPLTEEQRLAYEKMVQDGDRLLKEDPFFADLFRLNQISSQVNGELMNLIYSLKVEIDKVKKDVKVSTLRVEEQS